MLENIVLLAQIITAIGSIVLIVVLSKFIDKNDRLEKLLDAKKDDSSRYIIIRVECCRNNGKFTII